jgi:ribosomal protein L7/L12
MAKVILDSWRAGLEKVSLTKLQVNMLGMSLKESKTNVDSLLDDKKVVIEIDNLDVANEFLREAEKIGVNCKLVLD